MIIPARCGEGLMGQHPMRLQHKGWALMHLGALKDRSCSAYLFSPNLRHNTPFTQTLLQYNLRISSSHLSGNKSSDSTYENGKHHLIEQHLYLKMDVEACYYSTTKSTWITIPKQLLCTIPKTNLRKKLKDVFVLDPLS